MLFVAPFNTQSYSGYLDWAGGSSACNVSAVPGCTALGGEGGGNTPAQVFAAGQSAALANLASASYTSVGMGYHNLIVTDVLAPSKPSAVTAQRTTSTTVTLTWAASADDVGVAGYHVSRDGKPLSDVLQSPFQDTGLSANSDHTYQVQAFDLAGNVSEAVSVPIGGCSRCSRVVSFRPTK
jgi:hypothetical protein